MSPTFVRFHHVHFSYSTSSAPLLTDVSLHLSAGWTGVVGANGAGKTTLLRLATGALFPDAGTVEAPPLTVYCPQRTDDPPDGLGEFLADPGKSAARLRDRLALEADWYTRWGSLSHGERKRAQLAVALWTDPDVLAVDEPTNHLDSEARALVTGALADFGKVGLLVSHDRALLDDLCARCVFVEPPDVIVRPGGYTAGAEVARQERAAVLDQLAVDRRALLKTRREATRRETLAATADRRRSKRGLDPRDHDARDRLDRARVSGKDGVGGRLSAQLDARLERQRQRVEAADVRREFEVGIAFVGEPSRRDRLACLAAGALPLGPRDVLTFPELVLRPTDRVALTGRNGAGKSTLLHHLVAHLELPPERVVVLPQELEAAEAAGLIDEVRALPPEALGHLMTLVSRLNSRPQRLLDTRLPSPGEARKLQLALGLLRNPWLIVMDEPTNHLDLPSIEALEAALADVRCALLLVSHDLRFLERTTTSGWRLDPDPARPGSFVLMVT